MPPRALNLLKRPSRPVCIVVTLLALVLIVRLAWGWHVSRQLHAQLTAIRARGEPVAVHDLPASTLPDSRNAWHYQSQAASALNANTSSPRNSNIALPYTPPYSDEWMKLAQASERAHAKAFVLARQARGHTEARLPPWHGPTGLSAQLVPSLNQARSLANTLADGATLAHVQGDDAEALERLFDLMHLARSLRQDGPLVSQLIATAIEAIGYHTTQVIAPGLRLDPSATTWPATAQTIRHLVAQLGDESLIRQKYLRGWTHERLFALQYYSQQSEGTWLIRPLAERELIRENNNIELLIEASRCDNYPSAQAVFVRCHYSSEDEKRAQQALARMITKIFGTVQRGDLLLPRYSRWFTEYPATLSNTSHGFQTHFRVVAERRATAVSLACQLYRADHGRWPAQLDQLVPAYLAAVPIDPFSADGNPLGYIILKNALPDGGDRPLVYYDEDAGAPDTPIPDEPNYAWRNQQSRQYRDISRFIPSSKAVDHNPHESDAPRDDPEQDDDAE